MGLSDPLGSALWRVKYDNDSSALNQAITLLRQAAEVTADIAELAIIEWANGACRSCNGMAWIEIDQKRVDCTSCRATGLHRFSDRERADRLRVGLGQVRRWSGKIKRAHDVIGGTDIKKGAQMSAKMVD